MCVPYDEYLLVMLCTFNPWLSVEGPNMGVYGLVMVACCDMVMIKHDKPTVEHGLYNPSLKKMMIIIIVYLYCVV